MARHDVDTDDKPVTWLMSAFICRDRGELIKTTDPANIRYCPLCGEEVDDAE